MTISKDKADRELAEARSLYAAAESFKGSAQRELASTHSMVEELFLDGYEVAALQEVTHVQETALQEWAWVLPEGPNITEPDTMEESPLPPEPRAPLEPTHATHLSHDGETIDLPPQGRFADSQAEGLPLAQTSSTHGEPSPEASNRNPAHGQSPLPASSRRTSGPASARLEGSLNFSERLDNLVKQLIRDPQYPSPDPSDSIKHSPGVKGGPEEDPSPRPAKGVREVSLKQELAELRRSLESIRSPEDVTQAPSTSEPWFLGVCPIFPVGVSPTEE